MDTKMLQLCYVPAEEGTGYFLNNIYCSDMNMIHRIGEWFAVMNEIDHFYVLDSTTRQGVAVELEMPNEDVITVSELRENEGDEAADLYAECCRVSYDQEDPYEYPQD